MRYKHTKEDLEAVIKDALSIAEVCRKLGIRPIGGNYKTLKSKILKWNLDISHFTGRGWNVGLKFKPKMPSDLSVVMVENSSYVNSNHLKKRLLREKVLDWECKKCKLKIWNNFPIPLELNHINGNNLDHRLENLELLCPNCHAQTPNYRGKNLKKSARSEKIEVEYRKFKETPAEMRGNLEPSLINKEGAETLHGTPKLKNKVKKKSSAQTEISE